jgi:hypothetical protein
MSSGRVLGTYRLVVALLTALALAVDAHQATFTGGGLPNFFSYLTTDSNILAVLVLGYGGFAALTGRTPFGDYLRGATVLYLTFVGAAYWLLLRNDPVAIPWVNDVVHGITPLAVIVDWVFAPPRTRLTAGRASRWLIFPIVYLFYTFIRGPIVHWYPYSFISPYENSYLAVVATVAALLVGVALLMLVVMWAGNALERRTEPQLVD